MLYKLLRGLCKISKPRMMLSECEEKLSKIIHRDNADFDASFSEELVCEICFKFKINPKQLCCGHSFCFTCLRSALKHKEACPKCRQEVRGKGAEAVRPSRFEKKCIQEIVEKKMCEDEASHRRKEWIKSECEFKKWERSVNKRSRIFSPRSSDPTWDIVKVENLRMGENRGVCRACGNPFGLRSLKLTKNVGTRSEEYHAAPECCGDATDGFSVENVAGYDNLTEEDKSLVNRCFEL